MLGAAVLCEYARGGGRGNPGVWRVKAGRILRIENVRQRCTLFLHSSNHHLCFLTRHLRFQLRFFSTLGGGVAENKVAVVEAAAAKRSEGWSSFRALTASRRRFPYGRNWKHNMTPTRSTDTRTNILV